MFRGRGVLVVMRLRPGHPTRDYRPWTLLQSSPNSCPSTWVGQNRFRVLNPKAQVPYRYSRETTKIAVATPIGVLSRIRPGYTVLKPKSHYAAEWEALVK
jgi:hypothetical protein